MNAQYVRLVEETNKNVICLLENFQRTLDFDNLIENTNQMYLSEIDLKNFMVKVMDILQSTDSKEGKERVYKFAKQVSDTTENSNLRQQARIILGLMDKREFPEANKEMGKLLAMIASPKK